MCKIVLPFLPLMARPDGDAEAKRSEPGGLLGLRSAGLADAKALFDHGALFVDLRSLALWRLGRIPGAINKALAANIPAATSDRPCQAVVFYDQICPLPAIERIARLAAAMPGRELVWLPAGLSGWSEAGLPLEAG